MLITGRSVAMINRELDLKLDRELALKIINTVKKLPDDIYEYVLRDVQFGKAMDCFLPLPEVKKNFLVLLKEDASEATISHEIAHAYLKHPAYTNISVEQAKRFEEEARKLSNNWLSGTIPS
jgi:hypothetical protein